MKTIDKKFLEKNTRIKNALFKADIKTYEKLIKYDYRWLYYNLKNIGRVSLTKIHKHLINKGYDGIKNYEKYSKSPTF